MAEITNNIELSIFASITLFFVAALAEIGGGYLVWKWLRERKGLSLECLAESFYSYMELSPHYNLLTLEECMLHMAEYLSCLQSYGDFL